MTKFYSAKYFLQYTNNPTTDKLVNFYSNFLTVVHIGYNGENGDAHRSSTNPNLLQGMLNKSQMN